LTETFWKKEGLVSALSALIDAGRELAMIKISTAAVTVEIKVETKER
jgi:hypothetical protein